MSAPCPPALDLAFAVDADPPGGASGEPVPLAPALGENAGGLADPGPDGTALWQDLLGGWLADLLPELPPPLRAPAYSLGLRLTDDGTIAALNRTWRGIDGPTDVLAFAALEEAPPGPPEGPAMEPLELGDIVISLETAGRQAEATGHGLAHELRFLASHGLLHLLGWDHPDEPSLAAMLARQDRLLTGS